MILSFWTDNWANSVDPDQTAQSSLISVYMFAILSTYLGLITLW